MKTTVLRDSADGSYYVRVLNKVFIDKDAYNKLKSKLEYLEKTLFEINKAETLEEVKKKTEIYLQELYGNKNNKA
jgi:tetrahydromethanopterin S-methyltransferase subunit G